MSNTSTISTVSSETATFNKLIDAESAKVYSVEKVKNNSLPLHFLLTKDTKVILLNGQKVTFMRNAERTQYVAFTVGLQNYYIRDHSVLDSKILDSYVKPSVAKKATYTKAQLLEMLTAANIEVA